MTEIAAIPRFEIQRGAQRVAVIISVAIFVFLLFGCSLSPDKRKARYLRSGEAYLEKGKYSEASIEFRNAIQIDPQFAEAHYQLAKAELAVHDWSGAYRELNRVLEIDPARKEARLDRGRLELASGARDPASFSQAEDDANLLLKQDSKSAGAHEILGASYVAQKKYPAALQEFATLSQLEPGKGQPYENMALVEMALGRPADAEQSLTKAIQVEPKAPNGYVNLAKLYELEKKSSEAEKILEQGEKQNPGSIPISMTWATILDKEQKWAQAETVLDSLRKQTPKSTAAAIAIGDYYLQGRKMSDKALEEYQRGLTLEPKNLALKERIEDVYLSTGKADAAALMDADVMRQAPRDMIVRANHGRLLLAQGKTQDAVNYLQETAVDFGDSYEIHYYLGIAYLQNNNPGPANSELQKALQISPGWPMALEGLVRLNLAQNNAGVAEIYARELVQERPSDLNDRLLLGGILLKQGQTREAEAQFLAAKQLAPNQAAVHLDLGQMYTVQKRWPEAEREFASGMQLEPKSMIILGQYANFLVARKQSAQALSLVQKYVNANPNDVQGHILLGMLESNAKNYDAAQLEFTRAVQLAPKQAEGYLRLAQTYQQQNQLDDAIAQYQKAESLLPKSALLFTEIGNLYLQKGDLQVARTYYVQALALDTNFAVANANLAWVDAQEGKDLDVALAMAQKAKSLMPDLPSITDTLAWVMYKNGNYSGAIPLLRDCVKKAPDSGEYHFHLGMSLLASGEKARGESELHAALALKLDSATAQQARQALGLEN